jgi:transcriptional regulator with XRE-family HTH domain
VDTHIGSQVRQRRTTLAMSQQRPGEALGVAFQQVQKYERGSNRMSASTLDGMSLALGVPVSFFFEGMEPSQVTSDSAATDLLATEETREPVRAYYGIPPEGRRSLSAFVKSLSRTPSGSTSGDTTVRPKRDEP